TVPAAVPSVRPSSLPVTPSLAAKYRRLPDTTRPNEPLLPGWEPSGPGRMSLTTKVPAAVPSLRHSSVPRSAVVARDNRAPLTLTGSRKQRPALPAATSLTRAVPAAVPSVFHSSAPVTPSSAWKNRVPLTTAGRTPAVGLLLTVSPLRTTTVPASVPSL